MPSVAYYFPTNIPFLDKINLSDSSTAFTPLLHNKLAYTRFFLILGTWKTLVKISILPKLIFTSTVPFPRTYTLLWLPISTYCSMEDLSKVRNCSLLLHTYTVAPELNNQSKRFAITAIWTSVIISICMLLTIATMSSMTFVSLALPLSFFLFFKSLHSRI